MDAGAEGRFTRLEVQLRHPGLKSAGALSKSPEVARFVSMLRSFDAGSLTRFDAYATINDKRVALKRLVTAATHAVRS